MSLDFVEITAGNGKANAESIQKFGHNNLVSTSYVPITLGGFYRTPLFNAGTTLRVKAGGNANDTAAGTGARLIRLEGLDSTGAYICEDLATAGASASAATTNTFVRLFRTYVKESGTYATQAAGSHAANIVIEKSAGSEDWATIQVDGFPQAQSGIAAYTVPAGKTAYIKQLYVSVSSTKVGSIILFQRTGANKTSAPYDGMRMLLELHNIENFADFDPEMPLGPFKEFTDLGVLGKFTSGTAEMDVAFEILLRDAE
jgi:hypothetical protein